MTGRAGTTGRGGRISRVRVGLGVVVLLFSALAGGMTASAAPLTVEDINPDSSIVPQGVNNSQGGRVNGLKVAAGSNQVAYAATEWGGIFKTTDGALNWVHLDNHLPQATFDVDVDPSNTQIVYATSLYDGRVNSMGGINVSYDGGATWTHPVVPDTAPACTAIDWDEPSAFGIAISPDAPNNAFIGTACGIAVTNDSGVTWSHVDPDPADGGRRIWDVVAQAGGIVDICGETGHHRSLTTGASWSPANTTPNALPLVSNVCSIAASPLESNVLYSTQFNGGLRESSDGGANWTLLEDGLSNRRPFVVTNLTGANSFDLYYGAGPRLRRVAGCDDSSVPTRCPAAANLTDGFPSTHGTDITGAAHADTGDLEFDPTDATPQCPYLFSNDGGIYRSDDCAPTWVRSMVGMHDTWLYDLAAWPLPGNQTGLAFGLMDSGYWYSTDGGSSWGNPLCCDIWDVMADAERVIFTKCCPTTTLNQAPANNPGADVPMNPPPAGYLMYFQEVDSMQPFADDSYVFVTQTDGNSLNLPPAPNPGGIWITQNVGASYSQLGVATTPANACGVEVAISGGVPTFYVITDDLLEGGGGLCNGSGGRLWKYTGTNTNGTWTAADTGLNRVGIFGVDPNNPNRLYASERRPGGPRMVFSTDGGASWNPDSKLDALMTGTGEFKYQNNFGPEVRWPTPPLAGYSQPVMVAYHPTNPNVIIAGATDSGLFMTSNGGQSWALVTDDLPRVWHHAFDPFDDSIFYVGTVGRGVWKVTLPDIDLGITKLSMPAQVLPGGFVTSQVNVTNNGPDDAPSVTVFDTLSPQATFVSANGATCVADTPPPNVGQLVTCEVGTVPAGGNKLFTVVSRVGNTVPAGTVISNTVTVTAAGIDSSAGNDTAQGSVTVRQVPTVTSVTSSPNPSDFGQTTTFTATVTPVPLVGPSIGGTVTFNIDGIDVAVRPTNFGNPAIATLSTAGLQPGAHKVIARYSGDANFLPSSSSPYFHKVTCTNNITGQVNGNLTLTPGSWCIRNASIPGSITAQPGAAVSVFGSTIGSFTSDGAVAIGICYSRVTTGPVTIRNSTGFVLIGDPGDLKCAANSVDKGVTLLENNAGGVEVSNNSLAGLTVNGTTGTGPFPENSGTEIERNRILGNLSCSLNVPAPTNDGSPNQVTGSRSGQCSAANF